MADAEPSNREGTADIDRSSRLCIVTLGETGPVVLAGPTPLPEAAASVVTRVGDFRPLAVSRAYDVLTGPLGPLVRVAGLAEGRWALRVSGAFRDDRSWEAAVAFAHLAAAAGVDLVDDPDRATRLVVVAGALDADLGLEIGRAHV